LTSEEFARLLTLAKLSAEEKEIATQCIVWHMCLIDVGETVHMSRSTVSRRMRDVILPELETILKRNRENLRAGA